MITLKRKGTFVKTRATVKYMTDRALINSVLKKYRGYGGYFQLEKAAFHIKASKNKKNGRRLFLVIQDILTKGNFEISPEETARSVIDLHQYAFEDKELCTFVYSCAKSVFISLINEKDEYLPEKYRIFLSRLECFDFDSFYYSASSVNRILEKNNPDCYRESDNRTRRHLRRYLYRFAKTHDINEVEAAKIYRGRKNTPAILSFLYFPSLIILTLIILISLIPLTGITPALLLILPLFDSLRLLSYAILSKILIPSAIPTASIDKIPAKGRTIAVITTLIEKDNIDSLLEKLEDYHNATMEENVCFGILADPCDSDNYFSNSDKNDLDVLIKKFNALNKKYDGKFSLFIRKRSYIRTEGNYSGKERKRGAVLALCSLLAKKDNTFDTVICPNQFLSSSVYLITLDSDTRLGMGDVRTMVSAMLHPTNKPVIKNGRVIKGHAILQPKIATSLSSSHKTPFTITMTCPWGNNGYRSVDFELYQTLFERSTFCGKGILNIEIFNTLLHDKFQEERILSHDTIEGAILSCGYLSCVTLTDSHPQNPISYYKRQHRWIRGDIQSLPFIFKHIRNANGEKATNPLSNDSLGKWMIFDNIQRALLPVAVFLSLLYSFYSSVTKGVIITLLAISPMLLPFLLSVPSILKPAPYRFFSISLKSFLRNFCRLVYKLSAIPTEFVISSDAIIRSLWRMTISKKHLLEWTTADSVDKRRTGFSAYFTRFFFSSAIGIFLIVFSKHTLSAFFSILWTLFFFLAYCLAAPYPSKVNTTDEQRKKLRSYCLDAFCYFSRFVDKNTNYLPPDNYQISPVKRLAMRTSPTNIGLYLIVCASAVEFGFIDKDEMKSRITATLDTVERLPKYKGHLYNWYDISTLQILGEPFVSTVDSGNLIASLITLKEMLKKYGMYDLSSRVSRLADSMPLGFLCHQKKKLFAIGINTSTEELTENCYDLFMSEVRTTVYIAVCRKEVSEEIWYKMGCPIVTKEGYMGISSWSGTAFEYLMPAIFLPVYPSSLCFEALGFSFNCQKKDSKNGIWGRSESGYFEFDHQMNYQYKAFGTPSTAIDPDTKNHNVISPYSSFLSLPVSCKEACDNLEKMKKMGLYGEYGFYEAIDFTPSRVGKGNAVIYSWMSHHLSMSILSACNACFDNIISKSFMSSPEMRSGALLLQRSIPTDSRTTQGKRRKKHLASKEAYQPYVGGEEKKAGNNKIPYSSTYSNSIMSMTLNGMGMIKFKYKGFALSYPFFDSLPHLRGFGIRLLADKKIYSPIENASFTPFLTGAVYRKKESGINMTTSFSLHGELNALCVNITVEGKFNNITVCPWFEPVLDTPQSFESHPAFSGIGVEAIYDSMSGLLFYKRKLRENAKESVCLAIGIAGGGEFDFITRRENGFDAVYGTDDFDLVPKKSFKNETGPCINPICILKKQKSALQNKKTGTRDDIYSIDFII